MDIISTDNAPAAIGPYSQAIRANGLLFASGQIPVDPVYAKYFTSKPARSCVAVRDIPKGCLCEIEILALAD